MANDADVVIVGGGPAGLSAALVLGRCTRRVIVLDSGLYRNRFSHMLGGYLTRDGIEPREWRRLAMAEVRRYGVRILRTRVVTARRLGTGCFVVLDEGRTEFRARKLLLATGVADLLPSLPGLRQLYGTSVHHCPYCDAWAHRGKRLAAVGEGTAALGLALALRTWSDRVVACTQGVALSRRDALRAQVNAIRLRTEPLARLIGTGPRLRLLRFQDRADEPCDALFFNTGQVQRSGLPQLLRCRFAPDGGVVTDQRQCTGVPGLYLAGDADKDVQFAICAAAEGATAAVAINRELQDEDRGEPPEHRKSAISVAPARKSRRTT